MGTYPFLLFVHMPDLEPDIRVGEGVGGVAQDAVEAVERLLVLALLLVNDTEAE
jgi:hypothetical protein